MKITRTETEFLDNVETTCLNLCKSLSDSPKSLKEHLCRQSGYLQGYFDGRDWEYSKRFDIIWEWLQSEISKL